MPELPEVESVVRDLRDGRPSLVGRSVCSVNVVSNNVIQEGCEDKVKAILDGARFVAITRYGKYLLFQLESSDVQKYVLVIHLRMTGRLYLVPQHQAVERHTRLALILDDGLALRFDDPRKFGRVWVVSDPGEVTDKLGPDALTIGYDDFAARLAGRSRQLKSLLLDQGVLAGIGNIYTDESLFRAGFHPNQISSTLSSAEVRRLYDAVSTVLHEAVDAQGANIDGVFKAGSFVVSVYGRQGDPCPRCGSTIIKFRSGQRGTHVCPHCQLLSE